MTGVLGTVWVDLVYLHVNRGRKLDMHHDVSLTYSVGMNMSLLKVKYANLPYNMYNFVVLFHRTSQT